jgi:hypothetical protein
MRPQPCPVAHDGRRVAGHRRLVLVCLVNALDCVQVARIVLEDNLWREHWPMACLAFGRWKGLVEDMAVPGREDAWDGLHA